MKYKHLTECQRSQIQALKATGQSQVKIAQTLGVHCSTISRELKRNKGLRGYRYKQAQCLSMRIKREGRSIRYKMTASRIGWIEERFTKEQWSSEQISGLLSVNGIKISHTTLYKHIWEDRVQGGSLYKHLRHQEKKYNYKSGKKAGRGCIPNRVDISERAKVVENKSRLGDWEADTIIGKSHQGAVVSLVDRKSKFTRLKRVENKTSCVVTGAIVELLSSGVPKKTVTFDNGKEFSSHEKISLSVGVDCFFAKPYHSWERGLNEHTNGLVRQYLPKKTDFTKVSDDTIVIIEDKLNNRPRKVLGWRTPSEVMHGKRVPQKIALAC